MQQSANTEVDLLESLLQPMVAAGHSLREEDEAEAKEGQSPEEVQNQDLERFLQQPDPDPGLVPDEAADSDEDHDSLWSSMAEGLSPETLSSEEFQSLVDGFRNTVQDTMESAGQEDPELSEVMSQVPGILKKALESGEDAEDLWYDIHRCFLLLQDTGKRADSHAVSPGIPHMDEVRPHSVPAGKSVQPAGLSGWDGIRSGPASQQGGNPCQPGNGASPGVQSDCLQSSGRALFP